MGLVQGSFSIRGAWADLMFWTPCRMAGTHFPEAPEADRLKIETLFVCSLARGPWPVHLPLSFGLPAQEMGRPPQGLCVG